MLNSRCIETLELLLNSEELITVDDLSNRFSISNRMIRYDIDGINDFLKENNISPVIKRPNFPLKLIISKEEKDKILYLINNLNTQIYILSTDERVGMILYELLSSEKECTYSILQEKLSVSKSTIVSDLKRARDWLKNYTIAINKYSNKGILIVGEEKDIRHALTNLLISNSDYNIIEILEKIYCRENTSILNKIQSTDLSTDNIDYIKRIIEALEEEFGSFSDDDFMSLVINLFIIINRSKIKKTNTNSGFYNVIENDYRKEFLAAYKIVQQLEEKFRIDIDKEDINYLVTRILSCSNNNNSDIFNSIDYYEACLMADSIIININKEYKESFSMDMKTFESFLNHLKGLIFRLKFKVKTKNPIMDLILTNYKDEFNLGKRCCEFIEKKYNCELSEDELGYIAMYICATLERCKKTSKVRNILIVCSTGFATGRLLEARINKNFDVNVIGVTAIHTIDKYLENENIELIISTIKIDENYRVPTVVISPTFSRDDINILTEILDYKPKQENTGITKDILNIISDNCIITDKDKLIKDLNDFLNVETKKGIKLSEYLQVSDIQLNLVASDWRDAIRLSAKPLLKRAVISNDYVDAIIENVNRLGAYIVVDEGIAIPHAKPGKDVTAFGITITTFKEPIQLGDHKNVRLFITLATIDKESHIEIITQIMKLIEDEVFVQYLLNSDDEEAVYRKIQELKI
ncbi:BglG family transcription antiterminator [Clostridium vincentii]|uniref:Putative licABCH operon regulator n=1 Tax=Clostridium vincentii TaxID=52704 RepID=A0A2T0BDQ0_9CLOT|nr:BglG family transcription antiterminator [Clostridium vincentii]PRR82020.1 putative licABCH operon regulator [Clostridium vincentii]